MTAKVGDFDRAIFFDPSNPPKELDQSKDIDYINDLVIDATREHGKRVLDKLDEVGPRNRNKSVHEAHFAYLDYLVKSLQRFYSKEYKSFEAMLADPWFPEEGLTPINETV